MRICAGGIALTAPTRRMFIWNLQAGARKLAHYQFLTMALPGAFSCRIYMVDRSCLRRKGFVTIFNFPTEVRPRRFPAGGCSFLSEVRVANR
jgi:hypothetical protein